MNLNRPSVILLFVCFFMYTKVYSQQELVDLKPKFVTVTNLHVAEGFDFEKWEAVEKEYLDKVTNNIDLIIRHEVLVSYFSRGLKEIKVINVFNSWEDIHYVNQVRDSIIEKAWPNENERALFFEKQNSFYSNYHSDEIYLSSNWLKNISGSDKNSNKNPLVYYIDTNILADNDNEASYDLYTQYVNEVINKNPFIKAYLTHRHYWGADSREFVEVFVVESLTDLEKALNKNMELLKLHEPDEVKRENFLNTFQLAVAGHKEGVYVNVPSLSK